MSKPLLTQVMTELVASQSGLVPRPAALGGSGLDGKIIEVQQQHAQPLHFGDILENAVEIDYESTPEKSFLKGMLVMQTNA